MTSSSTQFQREAELAREHLSNRLEELRYQFTPANVVNGLLGANARGLETDDVLPVLAQTARKNPMACLLIAAGVGWLIYTETRGAQAPARSGGRRSNRKRRARNGKAHYVKPARRKPSR